MQAENKFFSLMDLMSAASKEASSLKEIWSTLMSDRESFNREREEMLSQIEDYSEIIESKDGEHQGQHREVLERRKEVEKLVVQVTTAMAAVTEQKQKVKCASSCTFSATHLPISTGRRERQPAGALAQRVFRPSGFYHHLAT